MLVATTRGWTHGGQYKKRYSLLRMDQTIVICWVECRLVYNYTFHHLRTIVTQESNYFTDHYSVNVTIKNV